MIDFSLGHSWCGGFEEYGEIIQEARPKQGLECKEDFTAGETRDNFPGRASCVVKSMCGKGRKSMELPSHSFMLL